MPHKAPKTDAGKQTARSGRELSMNPSAMRAREQRDRENRRQRSFAASLQDARLRELAYQALLVKAGGMDVLAAVINEMPEDRNLTTDEMARLLFQIRSIVRSYQRPGVSVPGLEGWKKDPLGTPQYSPIDVDASFLDLKPDWEKTGVPTVSPTPPLLPPLPTSDAGPAQK